MNVIILLLTAAWFVLAQAEPAHAELISGLISIISTAIASAGVIGKIILGIAFNLASSLLQKALTKKPGQKAVGVKLDIEIGDDIPVSTVVGYYATAGKRKYVATWGEFRKTPNAMITQVVELGNQPWSKTDIDDLELWIDDQKVTILTNETPDENGYPIKEFRDDDDRDGEVGSGIDDYAWIKFYRGTQTTTDPFLLEHFGELEDRPWLPTMIGRGVPYAIMTFRYRPKYFNTVPSAVFASRGTPLYDIRKDSTNGGNGPQRWDDQSTWEPSVNAAVIIYNIIRGLSYQGEWFFGGQNLAASRLPASNWIAAANECGRLIEIKGLATEPQFRAGLEITGDMEPLDVIDSLRAACNGRIAEVGGSFKLQVGAFGAAVFSITDEDIIITKGQSFEPFPSLDDTVNQINISYPNPDEKWGTKDGPALTAKDVLDPVTGKTLYETDGNRVLAADVQLPAVPFERQAQRIRRAMIKEERRFRTHRFYLPPQAWVLEPNDVLSWSSDRNGYNNKRFIVTDIQGEATMNQLVTIREIDPADYDWSPDFELPSASGYLGTMPVPTQPMEGWTVTATTITDANGVSRRPAIVVTAAANLDDVRNVRVQVRLKATGAVVFDSDQQRYDAPYAWTLSGVWLLPATEYEARGELLRNSLRVETEFSAWLPVTTPDVRFSLDDLATQISQSLTTLQDWINDDVGGVALQTAEDLLAEVQARVDSIQQQAEALAAETQARAEALQQQADDLSQEQSERVSDAILSAQRYRSLMVSVDQLLASVIDAGNASFSHVETLRTSLNTAIGTTVANFSEQILVAVADNKAVAQRVVTLEAETSGLSAKIVTVETARVSDFEALSGRMDLLSTGTDNQFDPAKLWSFDTTTEGWTGNGIATVAGGYLRPANVASDPYVSSPIGLAVNPNVNRQVRARVRKVGSPVWDGAVYWRSVGDTAWSEARRQAVDEPLFDVHGIGLITGQMEWAGTIDQVRLDLSAAQTATNYFLIDWIAVGAPSPGASRSELVNEQRARASGDEANALSVLMLQSSLEDAEGNIEALATGVSTIETTVTNLADGVAAQSEALTALGAEVDGKASVDIVNQLAAEVEAFDSGSIVSQGQTITAIRNVLNPIAAESIGKGFEAFLGTQGALRATAEASQALSTRIEFSGNALDVLAQAVTKVQAELPGKASAAGLQTLTSRVTATEGTLVSQSTAISQVQASLDQKASASALSSLQGTVSQQGDTINSASAAVTALTNEVAGKASAQAVSTLVTAVSAQGQQISSQSQAITSLQNDIGGKASAVALGSLTTTVFQQGDALSSQGQAITSLQNSLPGKADATALTSLSNTVVQQGATLSSQGEAITLLRNSLPGKADATAVTNLSTVVTQQGNTLTSQGTALTALQNAIAGKADASALSTLTTKVNEQGNTLTSQGSALTSVQATLGGKANTSDVDFALAGKTSVSTTNELTGYVGYVEGVVTSHGTAITNLQSEIAGKASASAVSTLSSKVTEQGGQLSAQASSLTSLTASMNGITANARLKAEVVSGPSGFSRIGFMASSESNGETRTSGLYIDVPNDASQPTEVIVDASRFAVIDGTSKKDLFAVVNGQTVITAAFIPVITTDRIIFGDGSIQETAIGQNATGERKFFASVDDVTLGASFTNLGAVTISKNDADYIEVDAVIRMQSSAGGTGLPSIEVVLRQSSTEVDSQIFRFSTVGELQVARLKYMVDSGNGSRTYSIIARVLSGNVFVGRRSLAAKRDKKSNA